MSHKFHTLKVSKILKETADTRSVYFDIPNALKKIFEFRAGQYLTLRFFLNSEEYERSYSICTSPHEGKLGITARRVDQGVISNYILDQLKENEEIELSTPTGDFVIEPDPNAMNDYYFFAAGSGIIPIYSIIKEILEVEPKSSCFLLFGNKNEESIIFKDQFDKLARKYTGQINITYCLSAPAKEKAKGLSGLFKKVKSNWQGWTGRVDKKLIIRFLDENPSRNKEKHHFICGPGTMIENSIQTLSSKGISKDQIHFEYFTISDQSQKKESQGVLGSKVKVHLNGQIFDIIVPKNKTILDALIDENYDPPYSCTSGACSTCVAKIISGKVEMEVCYALDEEEVAEGYILTCQSHPVTESLEIIYED